MNLSITFALVLKSVVEVEVNDTKIIYRPLRRYRNADRHGLRPSTGSTSRGFFIHIIL